MVLRSEVPFTLAFCAKNHTTHRAQMHTNGLFNTLVNVKEDKIYTASSPPETWDLTRVTGLLSRAQNGCWQSGTKLGQMNVKCKNWLSTLNNYNKLNRKTKIMYNLKCMAVSFAGQLWGLSCECMGMWDISGLICPQDDPSESIKWRQWTGGGNKAVYCHRWGRVCDAVEVVGPAGGTSGVQNEAPSGPCLRARSMIKWTCLHGTTVQWLLTQRM